MLILTDDEPRDLGWYMIDNRAPGSATIYGSSPLFEAHTYTCTHCSTLVVLNPERKRPRYKCNGCAHHICDACAVKKEAGIPCITLTQVIDECREAAARQVILDPVAISPYLAP